ncbi:MAG: alpha/beta hydrolase [Proteobacteria bacterium]|nr:alpha/beta hydrolase [Pseudomonadota bacterium]
MQALIALVLVAASARECRAAAALAASLEDVLEEGSVRPRIPERDARREEDRRPRRARIADAADAREMDAVDDETPSSGTQDRRGLRDAPRDYERAAARPVAHSAGARSAPAAHFDGNGRSSALLDVEGSQYAAGRFSLSAPRALVTPVQFRWPGRDRVADPLNVTEEFSAAMAAATVGQRVDSRQLIKNQMMVRGLHGNTKPNYMAGWIERCKARGLSCTDVPTDTQGAIGPNIEIVKKALEEKITAGERVHLVGHSYGGAISLGAYLSLSQGQREKVKLTLVQAALGGSPLADLLAGKDNQAPVPAELRAWLREKFGQDDALPALQALRTRESEARLSEAIRRLTPEDLARITTISTSIGRGRAIATGSYPSFAALRATRGLCENDGLVCVKATMITDPTTGRPRTRHALIPGFEHEDSIGGTRSDGSLRPAHPRGSPRDFFEAILSLSAGR